jgi:adenylyl-sulfate kinase
LGRLLMTHPPTGSFPILTSADRQRIKGHEPAVLWLTGLSGSGKTTLANAIEYQLAREYHLHTYFLDGDVIRTGLNKDLGFSAEARSENIRRIGEVARLFYNAGLVTLTAFISPFRADRAMVRALLPPGGFIEIFVRCPLAVCETRDPKGLYRKARAGQIRDFTGIDSAYEEPEHPELILDTAQTSLSTCVDTVVAYLREKQVIR